MALKELDLSCQEVAQEIYDSLEALPNSPQARVIGSSQGELRMADAFADLEDMRSLPENVRRLFRNQPYVISARVHSGKHEEGVSVGISLHSGSMLEGDSVYLSNNPLRAVGPNPNFQPTDPQVVGNIFVEASGWLTNVINSHK